MSTKNKKKIIIFILFLISMSAFTLIGVSADNGLTFSVEGLGEPESAASTVQILLILTVIALAPSILIMMTGFTRILIVLSFVRNALGLQQTPPNQVIIGLALFLTFFLMAPLFSQMNEEALQPFINSEINQDEAIERAIVPMRNFMLDQMKNDKSDLKTFLDITGAPMPETYDEIEIWVIIPAFIIGELKRAFIIGFFIYVPFLIIDLVVASTLMSLGMMMLPPAMIGMPFKLILFLIVDGWSLIVKTLMVSFH